MASVADLPHVPQPVVIALPAEIDMANAGPVGQQLGSALTPGVQTVIADMTATIFCDSSGISMLVRAHTPRRVLGAAATRPPHPAQPDRRT
jgi:anti-anti-sigma regulatory factor